MVPNPFEYAELGGYVHLSCFGLMIPILAKFGPKKIKLSLSDEIYQMSQLKNVEFDGDVHLPYFGLIIPFFGQIWSKKY